MANNYKNTSLFEELCGTRTEEPQLNDAPGPGDSPKPAAYPSAPEVAIPQHIGSLNALYDGRTVRPAGHMVVGSRAPVPRPDDPAQKRNGFETAQLFSSKDSERRRLHGSGAAVALACAVTVGSTAVFTTTIGNFSEPQDTHVNVHKSEVSIRAAEEKLAGTTNQEVVNAIIADELGVPSPQPDLAEPLQVASLGPIALPQSADSSHPNFIRVAQQDAEDLKVGDITGAPGQDLPINIALEETSSEAYSFIMIRGLPADITLSAGFRLKESWAVSLRDIAALTLKSPSGYQGDFDLEILLIKGRNTPAVSKVMNVSIHPQQENTIQAAIAPEPEVETAPALATAEPVAVEPKETPQLLTAAPAAVDPIEELEIEAQPAPQAERPALAMPKAPKLQITTAEETAMLRRAQEILNNGDIASARLLFEHLSGKGSVKATFALAETYDPELFSRLNVIGLRPEPETAKKWYAKAAEMGNDEASRRLSALENR